MAAISGSNIKGDPGNDKIIKIWVPAANQYVEVDKSTGGTIYSQSGKSIGYVSNDGYIRLYGEFASPDGDSINGDYIPGYSSDWE